MSDLRQFESHPDADQLNAFVEHTLPAHETEKTLAHLAICPDCRAVVALVIPEADEISKPLRARGPWFSGWGLAWIGAPALATLLVVAVYFRPSDKNHGPPARPIQTTIGGLADEAEAVPRVPPVATPKPTIQRSSKRTASASKRAETPLDHKGAEPMRPALAAARPAAGMLAFSGATELSSPLTLPKADPAENLSPQAPLPSELPILSLAANGRERLAIDARNSLFISSDEGRHWLAVPAQWQGRAVKVSVVSLNAVRPQSLARLPALRRSSTSAAVAAVAGRVAKAAIAGAVLTGRITDTSGAAVPRARVALTDTRTALARTTNADDDGRYLIENLDLGSYKIEADAPGFSTQASAVEVASSQPISVNLTLSVGASSQSVEVTSGSASIVPENPVKFQITTDQGDHWTSADGQTWTHP